LKTKTWLTTVVCVISLFAGGCTPIRPARKSQVDSTTAQAGADAAPTDQTERTEPPSGDLDERCTPGQRMCADGSPSRQPVACDDAGTWQMEQRCNEGQRCDPEPGNTQGTCVKLARECVGRSPDEQFCDGSTIRACANGVSSVVQTCGDQQRCIQQDERAKCECGAGAIDVNGMCQVATSCDIENGGCDALTACTAQGAGRVCGACPPGYTGDGDRAGCSPVLLALDSSEGVLAAAPAVVEPSYQLKLPLVRQELLLTPTAAPGVKIKVNDQALAEGAVWRSGPLNLGMHVIVLALTAENGLSTRYEVTVERTGMEVAYLKQRAPDQDDAFGYVIAVDGDTLVVGACGEDSAASGSNGDDTSNGVIESGAVFVYQRSNGQWQQSAYLKAPTADRAEYFGGAVAVRGNTMLVGATRASLYVTDAAGTPDRPGLVYVYERAGADWTNTAVIASQSARPDLFGFAIELDDIGAVIGAPFDSADGDRSGAVYSVTKASGWQDLKRLSAPEPKRGGSFGWSFALEGDSLLVGAPSQASALAPGVGNAYMFSRAGNSWELSQKLSGGPQASGASFGYALALQGNTAVVSAPFPGLPHANNTATTPHGLAFVYERGGGAWMLASQLESPTAKNNDYFGISVALAGNSLLVGASGDPSAARGFDGDPNAGALLNAGAFHAFARDRDGWTATTYVKPSSAREDTLFGEEIEISGDTIVVGAEHDAQGGAVWVFE
jgi:hypothetical protein